jgi:hypothetical protein
MVGCQGESAQQGVVDAIEGGGACPQGLHHREQYRRGPNGRNTTGQVVEPIVRAILIEPMHAALSDTPARHDRPI